MQTRYTPDGPGLARPSLARFAHSDDNNSANMLIYAVRKYLLRLPSPQKFQQACKVCYPNLKPFGLGVYFWLGKLSRTVKGRSLDSERSLLINFDPSQSSSCSHVNCLLQSPCSTHLRSNLPVLANTLKLCTLQMSHLSATPMPTHSQTHIHTLEAAVNCNNNCQTALAAIVGAVNACATVDNCIKLAGHTRLTAGAAILPLESSRVEQSRAETR